MRLDYSNIPKDNSVPKIFHYLMEVGRKLGKIRIRSKTWVSSHYFYHSPGMYFVPYFQPPGEGGDFFKSFGKIFKLYRWEKKKKGRERRKRDEKTKREKKKGGKRDKRG